ncbi:hypothetical protein AB0J38_28035 [Streptomyces sp. NPDC050095]|uniref:hypothetical protein n=1 Tax=unclassified Streptomyces TaxID=2593676 RepID=UPI003443B01D
MYAFGMLALFGLATLVAARVGHRYLQLTVEIWAFALIALGVGAAWLADFDLFAAWSLPVRNGDIATTLTGLFIAGAAYFWHEVLRFFAGLARKLTDEAATLEKEQQLRRVA